MQAGRERRGLQTLHLATEHGFIKSLPAQRKLPYNQRIESKSEHVE